MRSSILFTTATFLSCGWLALQSPAQTVQRTQPQERMATQQMNSTRVENQGVWKASEVIGMNVRGSAGDDNIGSIKDLVLSHDGHVKYAAVSFGGFLGMGDKLFAVPLSAMDFIKSGDDHYARIDVTEQTLKAKRGFNQDHWPTEADPSFASKTTRRQASNVGSAR